MTSAERPAGAVVVRNPWWLRLLALPLVGVGVIAGASVVAVVGSAEIGGARWVVGPILLVLACCGLLGGPVALLLKETFSDTEITMRKYVRTYRIDAATASRIRMVRAAVHTGRRMLPVARLQVVGDESRTKLAPRAILDDTLTNAEEAMAVLDEWVRRRPELVAADPAARQVFVDRGVLAPAIAD